MKKMAVRGLTIEPARALMIDDRVGSLEPGKDADVVITTGSIVDPRNYVKQVFIDGASVYDIRKGSPSILVEPTASRGRSSAGRLPQRLARPGRGQSRSHPGTCGNEE